MNTYKYIIYITSGQGPAECCWVVARVIKEITKEAKQYGYTIKILEKKESQEKNIFSSASVEITGKISQSFLESWTGTILWIGNSQYRKFHKRRNWFIGIHIEKISDSQFNQYRFKETDIEFQYTRSGGPGGQHVNKVSTAVRAIHKQNGLQVFSSESRSQSQNKQIAIQRLKNLIEHESTKMQNAKIRDNWSLHNNLVRGNPVRTYTGKQFKLTNIKKYKNDTIK